MDSIQTIFGTIVTLLLASGIVWGTFHGLGFLIRNPALALDLMLRLLSFPLRRLLLLWHRPVPYLAEISLAAQGVVGVVFFLYFIFQVEKRTNLPSVEVVKIFAYFVVLLLIAFCFVVFKAATYRPQFARILFYHRFVKPVWDWVTSQSYALLWLQRVPLLHPVIGALDEVANRVDHRRWQTFLRSLFFLSLFTLPVRLLPESFHVAVDSFAASLVPERMLSAINATSWLQEPETILAAIYHLLLDWVATVFVVYFVVRVLCPLEPRNLFPGIAEALRYFVEDRKTFVLGGYFWQNDAMDLAPTIRSSDSDDPPLPWADYAQILHQETLNLDKFLSSTWQGVNSRVSLVFEEDQAQGESQINTHRVHYRRMGESAFVAAVDSQPGRSYNLDARSQVNFMHLSESIGCLINVRQSLKYSSAQSGGSVFW